MDISWTHCSGCRLYHVSTPDPLSVSSPILSPTLNTRSFIKTIQLSFPLRSWSNHHPGRIHFLITAPAHTELSFNLGIFNCLFKLSHHHHHHHHHNDQPSSTNHILCSLGYLSKRFLSVGYELSSSEVLIQPYSPPHPFSSFQKQIVPGRSLPLGKQTNHLCGMLSDSLCLPKWCPAKLSTLQWHLLVFRIKLKLLTGASSSQDLWPLPQPQLFHLCLHHQISVPELKATQTNRQTSSWQTFAQDTCTCLCLDCPFLRSPLVPLHFFQFSARVSQSLLWSPWVSIPLPSFYCWTELTVAWIFSICIPGPPC